MLKAITNTISIRKSRCLLTFVCLSLKITAYIDPFSNSIDVTSQIKLMATAYAENGASAAIINIGGNTCIWQEKEGNAEWQVSSITSESIQIKHLYTGKEYLIAL